MSSTHGVEAHDSIEAALYLNVNEMLCQVQTAQRSEKIGPLGHPDSPAYVAQITADPSHISKKQGNKIDRSSTLFNSSKVFFGSVLFGHIPVRFAD